MFKPPFLQPYKGKATRHTCPACGAKESFTLYISGETNELINSKVGKCNRESKCGYHYTPKQFFIDNPMSQSSSMSYKNTHQLQIPHAPSPLERAGVRSLSPPLGGGRVGSNLPYSTNVDSRSTPSPLGRAGVGFGTIHFSFVQNSASYKSNFVRFLCEILTNEQIQSIGESYALGATKTAEVIFWQIDIQGKVRTGKIMQYNPATGRRIKHESGAIDWVHNKLKKSGTLPQDFNLQQCFFGEHLLTLYPDKTVAIVESEKSAIIASCIMPELVWLAAGNLNGLSIEKCQVLKEREIILYPDLGAYEKWSIKATEIKKKCNCKITISTLLEDEACDSDRVNGLDIADFIITEFKSKKTTSEIQSFFSPTLQSMIERNKALLILINGLQLDEV